MKTETLLLLAGLGLVGFLMYRRRQPQLVDPRQQYPEPIGPEMYPEYSPTVAIEPGGMVYPGAPADDGSITI
jgi:hypothetical protein